MCVHVHHCDASTRVTSPVIIGFLDEEKGTFVGTCAYEVVPSPAKIIGVGPALLVLAGRRDWVPNLLFGCGLLAGRFGVLSFRPYFVPAFPLALASRIVPVGIGWTLAVGIVLIRQGR